MVNRKVKKSTKTGRSRAGVKHSFRKKDYMNFMKDHGHFVAVLAAFVGVSLFTMGSLWSSTNDYIEHRYSSVIAADAVSSDVKIVVEADAYEVFLDVMSNDANAEAIEALYDAGIVKGYDNGTFGPEKNINRAEFMVIVSNAVDADFGGKTLSNCFTDVADEWYATFVCFAKEDGWISGFSDGSGKPAQTIVKSEALKITFEALDYDVCETLEVPPYDDVELDAWYADYACSARIGSILPKTGLFNANDELTRGELVQVVYNVMKAKELL